MKEINFEFSVGSDSNFDNLVADIGFETQLVALLTQEKGYKNLRIRIYPPKEEEYWDFKLDEFKEVINQAQKRLWELRKTEEMELDL